MSDWGDDDMKEWLGGAAQEGQRELFCPDSVRDALEASFQAGNWSEKDVVPEDQPVKQADVDLWDSLIDDQVKVDKTDVSKADRVRFRRWLRALSKMDEDGDASSIYTPSKMCTEDIKAQGADTFRDLIFGSASLFLGKPAGKNDLERGEYAVAASKCQGGRDASKFKWKTFDTVLRDCKKDGSIQALEQFVLELTDALTRCDHRFAGPAGNRVSQWWMRGTRALERFGPLAQLAYFEIYVTRYAGRFLPSIYEPEFADIAQGQGTPPSAPGGASGKQKEGQKDEQAAISQQLSELIKSQTQMSTQVATLSSKLGSLQTDVNGLKQQRQSQGFVPMSERACLECGETGHLAAKCPNKGKK